MDLLVVGEQQEPGTRTRQEFEGGEAAGRAVGIDGTDRLDALRTSYEPAERELPTEEQLVALLEAMPEGHQWSWPLWALITYGCRPCEVFSLVPADDGTARCLTVKRKDKLPTWRTALALPIGLITLERSWGCENAPGLRLQSSARLNKNPRLGGKWADGIAQDFSLTPPLGQCGQSTKPERQPCRQNDGPQPRRITARITAGWVRPTWPRLPPASMKCSWPTVLQHRAS